MSSNPIIKEQICMNEQWLNLYRTEIEEFHKKTMAFAAAELPRKDYK